MRRLKAWWWKVGLVLVALLALLQFVPIRVESRSARDEPKWDSPRTRELAMRACGDCHSNETHVLWFEQAAPVRWYVANHVKEGRAALNFSEWHTAAGREAHDAHEPVERGDMPPANYTWFGLHGDAKLTQAEARQLIAGLKRTVEADPPAGDGRRRGGERGDEHGDEPGG